jgi:hypothetical protein
MMAFTIGSSEIIILSILKLHVDGEIVIGEGVATASEGKFMIGSFGWTKSSNAPNVTFPIVGHMNTGSLGITGKVIVGTGGRVISGLVGFSGITTDVIAGGVPTTRSPGADGFTRGYPVNDSIIVAPAPEKWNTPAFANVLNALCAAANAAAP